MLTAIGRSGSEKEAMQYLAYTQGVVADAHQFGICTRAFVMAGMPGQSMAEVETTATYLRTLQPTWLHARPYIPYPRVALGSAQAPEQIERLLVPLQKIADERRAVANRPPGLSQRLFRRLRTWF